MEVLLPSCRLDSKALAENGDEILYDEFFMAKLAYITRSSDIDIYQLQGNERIKHLLCGWNAGGVLCRRLDLETKKMPDYLKKFIVNMAHYTVNLWFSLEWEKCDLSLCSSLLVAMFHMRKYFLKIACLNQFNWLYMMNLSMRPWDLAYFKKNLWIMDATQQESSVTTQPATETVETSNIDDDIAHLAAEGLYITLLRLMQMFDAGCMELVKRFSIRVISAWNYAQEKKLELNPKDSYDDMKRCVNMICHLHLMAVYERDTAIGFEIDNLINSIRFYHNCLLVAKANDESYAESVSRYKDMTPAHLFALTCVRLNLSFQDFVESVVPDLSRESCNTLFGAISHTYATYLLANVLLEMNKLNREDFLGNVENYKRTLRAYVIERERSEVFMLDEVRKQKLQGTSHNVTCTVKDMTNFKATLGKGNRSSNLVNHKASDVQCEQEREELYEAENEKRFDPVFQTMPNNEEVTNEFYHVLSQTKYKGWHFAKLVLLLKIIGRELNEIEKWCYHPGLTTEFMMSLEYKLSQRFDDLACIFQDHIFMEQEFWLTAFYLRPTPYYYDKVIFCGTRFQRTVNLLNKGDKDEVILKPAEKSSDATDEGSCAFMNAKYGLLSSTFDVKQIAKMATNETAHGDYESLAKALRMLRLPENIIKDLLTVTFAPRHANFTWAAEWPILRKRCKTLQTTPAYKRELVESNMAEANDRLKYLKIDYDKYKTWPQLDYGTIEEGYENDYVGDDADDSAEDTDDDSDVDDDEANENSKQQQKNKANDGKIRSKDFEDIIQNSTEPDKYDNFNELMGGGCLRRISARRAAAVIASAMLKEDINPTKAMKKKDEVKNVSNAFEKEAPASATAPVNSKVAETPTTSVTKADVKESTISEKPRMEPFKYANSTNGFVEIVDIWNYDKQHTKRTQLYQQKASGLTGSMFKNVGELCKLVKSVAYNDNDSSSESDDGNGNGDGDGDGDDDEDCSTGQMNVSDTESSYSSDEVDSLSFNNVANTSRNVEIQSTTAEAGKRLASVKVNESNEVKIISNQLIAVNILEQNSTLTNETEDSTSKETGSNNSTDNLPIPAIQRRNFMVSTQPMSDGVSSTTNIGEINPMDRTTAAHILQMDNEISRTESTNETENEKSSSSQGSTQFNKQLTGKPKAFSEYLAAHLHSDATDDTSSQTSSVTQGQSTVCGVGSNSSEIAESDMEEKRRGQLIEDCLNRKCYVRMVRLNSTSHIRLRQLVVRVKRLNLEKYRKEELAKRRMKRSKLKPKYFYSEDNSNPAAQPQQQLSQNLRKRRSTTISESEEEYVPKPSKRRSRLLSYRPPVTKRTQQQQQQQQNQQQQQQTQKRPRRRAKSFSVVPRSASGLKVCISSIADVRPPPDCIEISSSEDDEEVVEVARFQSQFPNIGTTVADEDDPLFEKEADIALLR